MFEGEAESRESKTSPPRCLLYMPMQIESLNVRNPLTRGKRCVGKGAGAFFFFLTPIPSLDIPRRQGWVIDTNIKDEYKRCPWPSRRKRSQIIKMLGQLNGGLRVQNIVQASVSSDSQVDSESKKRSCAKSKRPLALSLLTEVRWVAVEEAEPNRRVDSPDE